MRYLQFFFRGRDKPISVPVAEADVDRLLKCFTDRTEPLHFIEFGSVVEHSIWVNSAQLQMVRFLLELDDLPFDPKMIEPSKQYPEKEGQEPNFDEIRWEVTFWIAGWKAPFTVPDLCGGDWAEISTSCDCGEQFIVITDEDGEELALRVEDIQMLTGIEIGRYSETQLELMSEIVKSRNGEAASP